MLEMFQHIGRRKAEGRRKIVITVRRGKMRVNKTGEIPR